LTKDIFVISKEDRATLYVARYPQSVTTTIRLTKVGELPIPTVTAADISQDGAEIILKNYQRIFYWKRTAGQSVEDIVKQTPVYLPYSPEPKGESVCWSNDGSGFFTTSEMIDDQPAVIYFHRRR